VRARSSAWVIKESGRLAWVFYLTATRNVHTQVQEHQEITDAIRGGNDRLTESLMWAHIEAGRAPTIQAPAASREKPC